MAVKMKHLFNGIFDGLNILLTGHTGFKGSWLSIWLEEMGAHVVGFSLPEPPTIPSNFDLTKANQYITDVRGDIRDYEAIEKAIELYHPKLIIHFAAQTTVLASYIQPKISFDTNVGGTVNLLEAVRHSESVKAVVVCSTDKVYENKEWVWGYRENDELSGYDPYSASKAMAELAVNSFRRSFFSGGITSSNQDTAIASVRAGNVLGGGDFTENGLLADIMRAIQQEESLFLRNPSSTRPWQYVLEPLSGYLCLASKLLQVGQEYAQPWNFGPLQHKQITTMEIAEKIIGLWGNTTRTHVITDTNPEEQMVHEAHILRLNWDKSADLLDWRPVYTIDEALAETVKWYKAYQQNQDMYTICCQCLAHYTARAQELGLPWATNNQVMQ
jgi:CDP-glucose 4,6-dehydratase